MKKGIKIFEIIGVQIYLDYTWFIIFTLVAWSLAQGYFPSHRPGLSPSLYWFMGLTSSLLLFLSVLIHELSHSYIANSLGLSVKKITLFIFGGIAQLSKEPEKAKDELKIAIAGPVSSYILAGIFWLLMKGVDGYSPSSILVDIFSYSFFVNLLLATFNLIPGFPLDGGRVLRAIWWARSKNFQKATYIASKVGKSFSMVLIFLGLLQILLGNLMGGVWFILIGMFLRQAAEGGYQQVLIKKALSGIKVEDIMTKGVITVDENLPVISVVEEYFFLYPFTSFPVLSGDRLVGVLTLERLRKIPRDRWHETLTKEVMAKTGSDTVLNPKDSAMDALTRMITKEAGRLPVVDGDILIGIIARRDIMRLLEVKTELGMVDTEK